MITGINFCGSTENEVFVDKGQLRGCKGKCRSRVIFHLSIAVEVTGVVGVSPALWYFRYISEHIFDYTSACVLKKCHRDHYKGTKLKEMT
jgi:hypothetical protein